VRIHACVDGLTAHRRMMGRERVCSSGGFVSETVFWLRPEECRAANRLGGRAVWLTGDGSGEEEAQRCTA
jgi:hypothetical protein